VTAYVRRSARVVVVDRAGRVLLWHARWHAGERGWVDGWFTPGGGIEPGESLAEAAARELFEETGLRVAPEDLGERVAWAEGEARLPAGTGTFRDDFFLLRVDDLVVSTEGHEDGERESLIGHRWWTVEELAASDAYVVPRGLAPFLRDVAAGRTPGAPVRLPWR
jgi:8-oxo-dGTP pyrophosphatase MutT (NUDIX family)